MQFDKQLETERYLRLTYIAYIISFAVKTSGIMELRFLDSNYIITNAFSYFVTRNYVSICCGFQNHNLSAIPI